MKNEVVNFNKCKDSYRQYLGAETKTSLLYNGKTYIVKFPKNLKRKQNDLNTSYANNIFSEYIGCHIFQSIGIEAQNTIIGRYTVNQNEKIVVGCEDFTTDDYKLYEFHGFQNSFLEIETFGRTPVLEELEALFKYHKKLSIRKEAEARYWEVFVVDALIGNFDRHSSNWGYLINERTGDMKLAPVYDCGSCLYPGISDIGIEGITKSEEEINKRIYEFPKAALMVDGEKVGYYEFLVKKGTKKLDKAILRIVPKIDIEKIEQIVDDTPLLSDVRRNFLKKMLKARYEKIIIPARERVSL